jgi:ankyrin repeat protein
MTGSSVLNQDLKAEKRTLFTDAQPSMPRQESSVEPVLKQPITSGESLSTQKVPATVSTSNDIPDRPKAHDKDNGQLLLKAAENGDVDEVERLLSLDTSVASKTDTDETALHLASRFGNKSVVEVLLKHNADVEARDDDGWVPLYGATVYGHTNIVALLLDGGSKIDVRMPEGWTPLMLAVGFHNEIVGQLSPILDSLDDIKDQFPGLCTRNS